MAEWIDRELLIKALDAKQRCFVETYATGRMFFALDNAIIQEQPAVEVKGIKHGEWQYNTDDFTPKMRCSVCRYNKPIVSGIGVEQEPSFYCSNCGAVMKGATR